MTYIFQLMILNLILWMKLCSWEFYLINTYLGNLKYRTLQGKSQLNQWALFTIKFLPNNTSLCTLCCSLVYPYLHYCESVWGSTYQSNLKLLINLQKRIIRIECERLTFFSSPVFKKPGIYLQGFTIQMPLSL